MWCYLLTLARLDIFCRQKTQQMFLTSSPASVLNDDIKNRGTFHKTNNYLLFGSFAFAVSAVNACVFAGSACDNCACGARSIIAQWCVAAVTIHICTTMHICFMLTTLAYGTEGLHFSSAFIWYAVTCMSCKLLPLFS